MATDHSISVITNSSVKLPINPNTGLPSTYHERISSPGYWEVPNGKFDLQENGESDVQKRGKIKRTRPVGAEWMESRQKLETDVALSPRDPMIEKLAEDMDYLSDEQFFERLQALKTEHQKTLKMCEQAYNEKVLGLSTPARDNVKDMSRPPAYRPVGSKTAWQAEKEINKTSLRKSFDMSDGSHSEESEEEEVETIPEHRRTSSLKYREHGGMNDSMERVKDMWKDFKVENYALKTNGRLRERPASSVDSVSSNKENQDTWSPIITIPQPFKMTMREANKAKKKTKALEELEKERLEKQKLEEAECAKKFKASPAPAHIYLPMYDEMLEQQETKRRLNHNYREELLRSIEKPFKFYQREEQKKRQKRAEALLESSRKSSKKNTFKAKPVPKVIEEDVMDKLAEEEEYRKIRVRMRAEEMLKESQMPPSMEAREKSKQLSNKLAELAVVAKEWGFNTEPTFRPRITEKVPDFDEQHRKMQWQLESRKAEKEATVVKPFNLRTSRILSNKDRIYEDMKRDEEELPENRWPYKSGRRKPSNIGKLSSAVTSSDTVPSMMTQSAELRRSHTKSKMTEAMQKEVEKLEAERRRRQNEKRLKKQVVEKAAANDITYGLQDTTKEKLRRFKQEEKTRQEEYRKTLREMHERVEERPLLFEKATQKIARERAERRYKETLARAGVAQDSLRSGGSSPSRRYSSPEVDSDDGSYKSPSGHYVDSLKGVKSPASLSSREYSYSNTFTKEETGLSEEDYSDQESIPDESLEVVA